MKAALEVIATIILALMDVVLYVLTIADFPWKSVGLNLAMMLGCIILTVVVILQGLAVSGQLPECLRD